MNDDLLELSMWRDGNIMHGNCLEDMKKLKEERDAARRSYCSLMEAYRGGDGWVTANKLGWGYLFEEDGK